MNPPTVIFRKVGKKIKINSNFLLFYPPTLNINCLVEKKKYYYFFEVLSVHF